MNYILMNLKRLMKRKVNIVFMLIAPFVLVTFSSMMGTSSFDLKIAYSDMDKSITSSMLVDRLKKVGSIYEVNQDQMDMYLISGDHEAAVIIGQGFEEEILKGEVPLVDMKSIQGSNVTFPAVTQIDLFVSSAVAIAKGAKGDEDIYHKALSDYDSAGEGITVETTRNISLMRVVSKMSIGFLFMNMLFLASQASSVLIEDKKKRVFYRIFSGPVTAFRYMFDNIVSFYIIMTVQILIILAAMFGLYDMYYGESIYNMLLLFMVFGIMSVSFGVAISSLSKTPSQAGAVSSLVITPISMLGGFFWDIELMPDFLQRISSFLPTSWGIKAAVVLLEGNPLSAITEHILVLLIFSIGFFVLGALKKADISRSV